MYKNRLVTSDTGIKLKSGSANYLIISFNCFVKYQIFKNFFTVMPETSNQLLLSNVVLIIVFNCFVSNTSHHG